MSSESTEEAETPHYAYPVLRVFPPFPTKIAILCHHAETNDIFLHGGRVRSSLFTKMNKVEIFLVETLVLRLGFDCLLSYLVQCICIENKLSQKIIIKLKILCMLRM
jgi:hypothetical protein